MNVNNNIIKCLFFLLFAGIFFSCEKTDDFKNELDGIPQISYGTHYKYKASYLVGDTLTITGILYPEKGLRVTVGETDAPIVKTQKMSFYGTVGGRDSLDQVSVVISEEMGTGVSRPVSIQLGENKVEGSPIDIYALVGEGSFTQPLKMTNYTTALIGRQNTYLHCINGKGDIYYLGFSDKNLWHIAKDGTAKIVLTGDELKAGESWTFNSIAPFLAGGVNPQGTKAWISINTQSNGYRFSEIDLQSKQVTLLNSSAAIAQPYEGNIATVKMVVSGVYPDSEGNVYLKIGAANTGASENTQAIALYESNTRKLSYLYKSYEAQAADLPGSSLNLDGYTTTGGGEVTFRIYPEENALYAVHGYRVSTPTGIILGKGITLYNLKIKLKLYTMKAGGGSEYIGPFSDTKSILDDVFGLLPVAGQRMVALYGQGLSTEGLPQWVVFSFKEKRTYQYAPGKAVLGSYYFGPNSSTTRVDEMLNYDEDGHLYMTAGGKVQLIKTAIE